MVVCVPYVDLATALEATKGTNIGVGAENCHWEDSGAYTGEISADMLTAMGVQYVIIGHSERRTYFGETDVTVNKRVRAALDSRPDRYPLRGRISGAARAGHHRRAGGHADENRAERRLARRSCPASSSLMSRSGQSAPARPPPPSRPTKSAPSSARPWRAFTARRLPTR